MDHNVLSIDIGSDNIKMVTGRQQGPNLLISSVHMFPTPQHSFQDGRITDMDAIKNEIGKAISSNNIKAKKVIFTIDSTSIIRRELELPVVKPEEMDSMVRFEIEQYLPIIMSEYVIEYKVQEEFTDENIKKARILVAALPSSIAEDFLQLVKELKLSPHALDINSNSISKLFATKNMINGEGYGLDKTVAFIDFGYSSINLNIISKGITKFSRLITNGGNDIDVNIANSFNLDVRQAENKKMAECNLQQGQEGNVSSSMINDMIRMTVDSWVQDIQRLFQYYTSRGNLNRIDEIYIYGGSSNLKGLVGYLNSSLNIPAFKISSINNIKLGKLANTVELEYYLNAIGAIIRK